MKCFYNAFEKALLKTKYYINIKVINVIINYISKGLIRLINIEDKYIIIDIIIDNIKVSHGGKVVIKVIKEVKIDS